MAGLSATHIIYQEDNGIGYLKLRPDVPDLNLPPNSEVVSSSNGILLFFQASTDTFCLFNPFIGNTIKPLPLAPRRLRPNSGIAILVVTESCFDVVFFVAENEAVDSPRSIHLYEADIYSSDTDSWCNMEMTDLNKNQFLPNYQVSCGRNVFSLVYSDMTPQVPYSVFRLDIVNAAVARFALPYCNVNIDPSTVQLGRIGNTVGLVIVNMEEMAVEIFSLDQSLFSGEFYWQFVWLVKVVLKPDCSLQVEDLGGWIIRCREMPRPVRFESFKIQVPLWVDGRVVMLEAIDDIGISLRFELSIVGSMLPSSINLGLPIVAADTRVLYQIGSGHL